MIMIPVTMTSGAEGRLELRTVFVLSYRRQAWLRTHLQQVVAADDLTEVQAFCVAGACRGRHPAPEDSAGASTGCLQAGVCAPECRCEENEEADLQHCHRQVSRPESEHQLSV